MRDDYECCEECGALLVKDHEGREYCKLCGWVKKDPTLDRDRTPSYVG